MPVLQPSAFYFCLRYAHAKKSVIDAAIEKQIVDKSPTTSKDTDFPWWPTVSTLEFKTISN